MKKVLSILSLGAFAIAGPASAVVTVTLSGLDVNAQFNASPGTPGAVSVPLGVASATHSFTVSNLDIAEDGSANDTVVFSYLVEATNGLVANIGGNAFSYGVDGTGDPNDNEIDPGEGLSFSNLGISVDFGTNPGLTANLDSANFSRFQSRFPGNSDVIDLTDANGDSIAISSTPNGGGDDPYIFVTPQPAFNVVSTAGDGFGIDSIAATFVISAVPEPSAFALLSLGGLGFLSRRRR